MYLKERFIKSLKYKRFNNAKESLKKIVSSIWESMKAKHFLINMGKNVWPLFLASPHRQRLGMLPADMPLQVCTLICCQNVGLQVRERFATYWSVHGVLIHTIFSTPVSFCQNAISEIDERTENVQLEEQKTQEKIRGHELCIQLIESLLWGKKVVWHYFRHNNYHKWTKVIEEWISAQILRKRASLLYKLCMLHLPFPPRFIPRSLFFFHERTLPQIYILLPLKFPF